MQRSSSRTSSSSDNNCPLPEPDPPDQDPPITEDRMPPKMRKRWKQQIRMQKRTSQSPAASIISLGSTDPGVESGVGLGIRIEEAPGGSKMRVNGAYHASGPFLVAYSS